MSTTIPQNAEIGGGGGSDDQTATEVPFSNTYSGLTATTVQSALDQISESLYIQEHTTAISYLVLPKVDIVKTNQVAEITITLPAVPISRKLYTIKDVSGNAETNNIIVDGNSRDIDGNPTHIIDANYASFDFLYDSILDKWNIL